MEASCVPKTEARGLKVEHSAGSGVVWGWKGGNGVHESIATGTEAYMRRYLAGAAAVLLVFSMCMAVRGETDSARERDARGFSRRIYRNEFYRKVKYKGREYSILYSSRIGVNPSEYEGKEGWYFIPGWDRIPPKDMDDDGEWLEHLNRVMRKYDPEWKDWEWHGGDLTPLTCESYAATYIPDWWEWYITGKPTERRYRNIFNGFEERGFSPRELSEYFRYVAGMPKDERRKLGLKDTFRLIPLMKDSVNGEPINYGIGSYSCLLCSPPRVEGLVDTMVRHLPKETIRKIEKELDVQLIYTCEGRRKYFMDSPPLQLFNHQVRLSDAADARKLRDALRKFGVIYARIITTPPKRYFFNVGYHGVAVVGYGKFPAGLLYEARGIAPPGEVGGDGIVGSAARLVDRFIHEPPRDPDEPKDVFVIMEEFGPVRGEEGGFNVGEKGVFRKPTFQVEDTKEIKEAYAFPHQLVLRDVVWHEDAVEMSVYNTFDRPVPLDDADIRAFLPYGVKPAIEVGGDGRLSVSWKSDKRIDTLILVLGVTGYYSTHYSEEEGFLPRSFQLSRKKRGAHEGLDFDDLLYMDLGGR